MTRAYLLLGGAGLAYGFAADNAALIVLGFFCVLMAAASHEIPVRQRVRGASDELAARRPGDFIQRERMPS